MSDIKRVDTTAIAKMNKTYCQPAWAPTPWPQSAQQDRDPAAGCGGMHGCDDRVYNPQHAECKQCMEDVDAALKAIDDAAIAKLRKSALPWTQGAEPAVNTAQSTWPKPMMGGVIDESSPGIDRQQVFDILEQAKQALYDAGVREYRAQADSPVDKGAADYGPSIEGLSNLQRSINVMPKPAVNAKHRAHVMGVLNELYTLTGNLTVMMMPAGPIADMVQQTNDAGKDTMLYWSGVNAKDFFKRMERLERCVAELGAGVFNGDILCVTPTDYTVFGQAGEKPRGMSEAEAAKYAVIREDTTCWECDENKDCKWRWDSYNTNGDCLAEK